MDKKIENVSELHLVIDWLCYFPNLETKITDSLQVIKKIEMKSFKNKK